MKKTIFQTNSFRSKYQSLINEINLLEDKLISLNDSELCIQNFKLRQKYKKKQDLNQILVESFALTREASKRSLGLRHYDVQLVGGLVLNNQQIAEMKTGEGKTLVATLPACLNALTNKGVHIVTVNDYLANRDQTTMGQIYRFLGFDTGLIQNGMDELERKKNYGADITYVTNYELVFDFLRDNIALNLESVVQRPFNYCIIDEVDSILIDEAQTPLIISNNIETPVDKYIIAAEITNYLELNFHYTVDEKNKNVILTEQGSKQIEQILSIQNLYDVRDPWIPYIINALKANTLFLKNINYIVQDNKVIIVDEFTGRVMSDRRWGDGLHQAIEAKENVPIGQKNQTTASMTYQNFFLLYPKLAGMTGTGETGKIEFEKIYNLSVEEIPTILPILRNDLPDLIYKDQFSKWSSIAQTCNQISITGQPILVGTTTVEKSEMLAQLLNEYRLSYQILNAKPENVKRESEIIAQAGKKNTITIATNMAGRGTDIILGGNLTFQIQKELYDILTLTRNYNLQKKKTILHLALRINFNSISQRFLSTLISLYLNEKFLSISDIEILKILDQSNTFSNTTHSYLCSIQFLINELINYHKKQHEQNRKLIKNLGGLYIMGTERNNSRRVDDQLRGRCGRQGDPGMSRFFLSLDDNLLRLFGGTRIQDFMRTQMFDNKPLESNFLTKSLNSAQQRVEERAYQQRKNLFEYDDILNKQRNIIYFERRCILKNLSIQNSILAYGEQLIIDLIFTLKNQNTLNQIPFFLFQQFLGKNFLLTDRQFVKSDLVELNNIELKNYLFNEFWLAYQSKINEFRIYGNETYKNLERSVILLNINQIWQEHLQTMSLLRDAVGWRGYGQRNPLFEYKKEAFYLFENRKRILCHVIIHDLFRTAIL